MVMGKWENGNRGFSVFPLWVLVFVAGGNGSLGYCFFAAYACFWEGFVHGGFDVHATQRI